MEGGLSAFFISPFLYIPISPALLLVLLHLPPSSFSQSVISSSCSFCSPYFPALSLPALCHHWLLSHLKECPQLPVAMGALPEGAAWRGEVLKSCHECSAGLWALLPSLNGREDAQMHRWVQTLQGERQELPAAHQPIAQPGPSPLLWFWEAKHTQGLEIEFHWIQTF